MLKIRAFAGLSAKNAQEVKAAESAGTLYLKLDSVWTDTTTQIGLYFYNSETNAFGTLQTPKGGQYLDYTYSLDFVPTYCIPMRVVKATSNWGSNIWDSDDLYSRTEGLSIDEETFIYLGEHYTDSKWTNCSSYSPTGHIYGGEYQNWTETTISQSFNSNYKVTSSGQLEVYGSATLDSCSFKCEFDNTWSQTWSCHSSLSSALGGASGSGNLDLATAGTYMIYYNVSSTNVYVTTAVLAEADEWAQVFSAGMVCDGQGNITTDSWSTLATDYENNVSAEAKALFVAEAHVEHDAETSTYLAAAVQRYDYIIEKYGTSTYNDFMGRIAAGKISAANNSMLSNNNNINYVPVIIIVSSIALVSVLGAALMIKRRKSER